jgi:hypothetical protein
LWRHEPRRVGEGRPRHDIRRPVAVVVHQPQLDRGAIAHAPERPLRVVGELL